MARRYARDNRGRFASSGSGATARGGRLRTASGAKRERQTMKLPNQRTVVLRNQGKPKPPAKAGPAKAVPKVRLGAEPDKARMLRNMTNPGVREAFAKQGGKAMSPLDATKVARSKATAEAARKFYGTSTRDRPKSNKAKPSAPRGSRTLVTPTGKDSREEARIRIAQKAAIKRSGIKPETASSAKAIKQPRVANTMKAKGRGPKTPLQRVNRKIAVNNFHRAAFGAGKSSMTGRQYQRSLKSSATLGSAKKFLETGKPQHTRGSHRSNKAANGIIRNAQRYLAKR